VLVQCPSCSSQLVVGDEAVGQRVRCPKCSTVFAPQAAVASAADPIACPSCSSWLNVGPHMRGKRVQCPKCKNIFQTPEQSKEPETSYHVTATVPDDPRVVAPVETLDVLPPTVPKRRKSEEFMDELADNMPARSSSRSQRDRSQPPNASWMWWVFGVGGIVVVELGLLGLAIFLESDRLRTYTVYLVLTLPISTGVLIAATYLSSIWFGSLEIGEIQVATVKAFILVAIVSVVSLIPYGGFLFSLFIWYIGIKMLFRLEVWETRALVGINWLLTVGLRVLLMTALASAGRQ
jgi:predicted Zn finger-like uncharacterized protein